MMSLSDLPPLPTSGVDFSIDAPYRGSSSGQDRVIDALHKAGWTLHRVFTKPNAMLPLPEVKFPAGRVYLFADDVAVVVQKSNGRVIASLPAYAALQTLNEFTPDVIEKDSWAAEQWKEFNELGNEYEPHRRWWRQNFFTSDGARWSVERTKGSLVDITKDGALVATVANGDEAEDKDMHPVICDLVDYVLSEY